MKKTVVYTEGAYNFDNSQKYASKQTVQKDIHAEIKAAQKRDAIAKKKGYETLLKRVAPEKVFTLEEQIAFVTRKLRPYLKQTPLSDYTKYKIAYLEDLETKQAVLKLAKEVNEGFKNTMSIPTL